MRRTGLAALAAPTTLLVAALWLAVACDVGTSTTAAPSTFDTPNPSLAVLSNVPTLQPEPSVEPSVSKPVATTETSNPSAANVSQPPGGQLSAGEGDTIDGVLGSYCYSADAGPTLCVDAPTWPPQTAPIINVQGARSEMDFTLADGSQFATWSARYYTPTGSVALGSAGTSFDPDANASAGTMDSADFAGPPVGMWTLEVSIRFADGGDAVYAWQANVVQ
jgi:hypothetical protein